MKMFCDCEPAKKSFEKCTDNEGYERLCYYHDCEKDKQWSIYYPGGTGFYIGNDLPPIKFCPWCGKEIK